MKLIAKVLGIGSVMVLAALVIWDFAYPWRPAWYRLSFVVETPDGDKTASGVRLVYDWKQPTLGLAPSSGGTWGAGEAIPVDLGRRGVLFVLNAPRNPDGTPSNSAVSVPINEIYHRLKGRWLQNVPQLRDLSGVIELEPQELPYLVYFRDTNDPKTVQAVDPNDIAKDLGAGVRLKHATLEFVSFGTWPFYLLGLGGVPLTRGIEKWLPWLDMPWEKRRNQDWGGMWTGYGSLNNSQFRTGTK